ncbi:UbiA family prenyltransferase [Devosia sp.]|uniref:UbiA family prenyltransferase n=1 Tax=Devosia sp. TaxID=1871048 RepID=UPI003265A53D
MRKPIVQKVQAPAQAHLPPLVLDVDDALIRTDLLHETAVAYVKANPLRALNLVKWLLSGKAVLKRKLGELIPLNVDSLPVNDELVAFAQLAHAEGRQVGIATAADELLAHRIAKRFDFVSFIVASDGIENMKGARKAQALVERFPDGFAYAADSRSDLEVWPHATSIVLAGASARTVGKAKLLGKPIEAEFTRAKLGLRGWAKALRVHQWAKNALVFVPLILSGMASHPMAVLQAGLAFAAMSLMASGTYLLNDLFDLADDRTHWTKRNRPLASGALRIKHGVPAAIVLIAASLGVAVTLGLPSFSLLMVYMATTLGYSFYIKRQPIVDVFTLASLFTLRLGIGITAVSAVPSPWLLVFSMFLFTSLSFAKRQTEIQKSVAKGRLAVSGRGYLGTDAGMVTAMGVATAMAAITIMVLYIMNDVYNAAFYHHPIMLWVFPAALFMWVSRIWLLCHREQLNDDPVAFAIRDRISIALGGLMGAAFITGWLF